MASRSGGIGRLVCIRTEEGKKMMTCHTTKGSLLYLHGLAALQSFPQLLFTPPRRSLLNPRCVVANDSWMVQASKRYCFTHHLLLVRFPEW